MSSPGKTDARPFRSGFPDANAPGFRTAAWARGVAKSAEELRPLHHSLLHALAYAARSRNKGITLLPDDEDAPVQKRTYRELCIDAALVAKVLEDAGLMRGERVVIALPTSFEFVTAFFAVEMAGGVPVPTYPPQPLERGERALTRVADVANASSATLCITDEAARAVLSGLATRAPKLLHLYTFDELEALATRDAAQPRSGPKDLAFIQYTSGSTGAPKGVALTHANLTANIHAIGQATRINRDDIVVSWLPLYHDMGLIGALLFSIYWRIPLVLMSPTAFLKRPSRWLRAIDEYRGTLSPAPNFAFALCAKRARGEESEGLDLSSWRIALNGAEPVNLRTVIDFRKAFEAHGFRADALTPCYGLAEASLAVTVARPGTHVKYQVVDRAELARGRAVDRQGKGSVAVVSCGTPVPGHAVLVVDEHGARLPEREVGHIVVLGPSVMSGYHAQRVATEEVLRGGWLWTGDLGYFADGELYVTGRAKDLIILRGTNHYAEDLERAAERMEGVRSGGTAAFSVYDEEAARERCILLCETRVTDKAAQKKLRSDITARVLDYCGVRVDEVVLLAPGKIPKTSSGKRQRSLCKDRYLSSNF